MPRPINGHKKVGVNRARRGGMAACTIVSRNYLAQAKVLAESFLRHEPRGRFYTLVVDDLPPGADAGPGVTVVGAGDIGLPRVKEMCFKYDVIELNTAVKPAFLATLLGRFGEDHIVYLDPDILVARPLDELRKLMASASIVLTPHVLSPIPLDGRHPSDQDILISGAHNLGFIALTKSEEALALLKWWGERLDDHCRIDVAHGLFTDQRWVDLVPGFFPSTALLRDPTYNVAFWNLHERKIERRGDDQYFVNGRPLAFYHFSGFNPGKRLVLSKHQDRVRVVPGTPLADLLGRYADLLVAAGHETSSRWEYGHSRFSNGVAVSPPFRQLYLGLDCEARSWFGDPFDASPSNERSLLAWATRPRPADAGLSRLMRSIYSMRPDVAAAFPDPRGRDRDRFVEWVQNQAPKEMGVDPELLRPGGGRGAADGAGKLDPSAYGGLTARVRSLVCSTVPAGATVAFVNKGCAELLRCDGRTAWHFPRDDAGNYAGFNPADGDEAVEQLEVLRGQGLEYLVIPATAFWWLDHYAGFRQHLEALYREMPLPREDDCLVYDVRGRDPEREAEDAEAWRKRAEYRKLVRGIRKAVTGVVPAGSTVVVASKGDEALLCLDGRTGWHFPQTNAGTYAGHHPHDSAAAIEQLEDLRERGGRFFVLPSTAFWWLDHYAEFRRHLESRHRLASDEGGCNIYELGGDTDFNTDTQGFAGKE